MNLLEGTTLEQLFARWTQQTPTHSALLAPDRPSLSFAQLGEQLNTIRETLRRLGLGRTARVALLAPNGPELALAFLGSSTSATCAPLNPAYQKDELAFYLEDLEASALLIASSLESPAREVAQARGIPVLEFHAQLDQPAGCFALEGTTGLASVAEQAASPDDVALVLHTSGTTARPKQVPLTHANLCASIRHLQQSLALSSDDCCLNLMPLFHIHGLVGALLAALGNGGCAVCPPGFSPTELFGWLHAFQPTWYTSVPTIHQAILAQARNEDIPRTSTALRFIRSSSASLPPTVMTELEDVFGVPVIEAYGMTEAAHQMASNPLPPSIRKPGSVGLPAGPEIVILSESGEFLSSGQVGEVAIKGPNVMTGYAQNPTANTQAFTQGWFRTGDQGYLDADGYLFLTGRLKELINRGGEKIAPVEIDQALLRHPSVQQAATFSMPHPTLGEEVAAAVVLYENTTATESELQHFLAPSLADFKVPRRIAIVSEIPKGPTGKLQRMGLADKLLSGMETLLREEEYQQPETDLEQQIAALWSGILGQKIIGRHDRFLQLGGDSISGAQLRSRIRDLFHVDVPWLSLFQEAGSVANLAAFIETHTQKQDLSPFPALIAHPDHTGIPLTFAQEPLWLAAQLDPDNTAYNRPLLLQLEGTLDIQALEGALHEIVQRHEPLRTTFSLESEGPKQNVIPAMPVQLLRRDLSQTPEPEREGTFATLVAQEVATPFDLFQGPVFRSTLFQVTESDHRLLIIVHHLVSDGWSDAVFFQELETLYNCFCEGEPSPLPKLSIHYADFAVWQQQWLTGKSLDSQLTYWGEQLEGFRSSPFLSVSRASMTDVLQPSKRENIILSDVQTAVLRTFARKEGLTPFTILLAGFFVFLHRWAEANDLIVGVPIANRTHPLLEPLIGFFVNVLPFRSTIHWENSSRTFMQKLQEFALAALTHSEVPIQELRQTLGQGESLIGHSLLQVLFVFENAPQHVPKLKDLACQHIALPDGGPALVNFSLFLWDHPQHIQGYTVFNEDVVEQGMIRSFINAYASILDCMMKHPDAPLNSIQLGVARTHNLLPVDRQQDLSGAEGKNMSEPKTPEGKTALAIRREKLKERMAKLSQSKQEILNKKLKRVHRPPHG
jgi:acyl-CoA synthetase (AMP-forming)/AMP-acid ligase II